MIGIIGSHPCIAQACLEVTYVVYQLCYVVRNALVMPMTMMLYLILISYVYCLSCYSLYIMMMSLL